MDKPDWDESPSSIRDSRRQVHEILSQACYDMERQQYNTVVSAAMKLFNLIETVAPTPHEHEPLSKDSLQKDYPCLLVHEAMSILLRLLSPICPHITHHLWIELGYGENILTHKWPKVANAALKVSEVKLMVQINGKLRAEMMIAHDAPEDVIKASALEHPKIQRYVEDKPCKKFIYIPGRLVNIVI